MKTNLNKGNGRRLVALIGAVSIAALFLLNLLLTYLGQRYNIFVDTTPEGLYTLTDAMKKECDFIDDLPGEDKVEILFCADPDTLLDNQTTALNYVMALELDKRYDRIETSAENVIYNPTLVSKYKATSLTEINPTDIIVSYGDRYRIINANNFWTADSEGNVWAYNGEYKFASVLKSVTAKNLPKAYFVTDFGCSYFNPDEPSRVENEELAAFVGLLSERGLEVKNISLSDYAARDEEIPDDCVLLIINNPQSDLTSAGNSLDSFYDKTETELLDRYLVTDHGSLMVTKSPDVTLPVFEAFLREWGFSFSTASVKEAGGDTVIGRYETDENEYAYRIYGNYAALSSAPRFVFRNTGYITCSYGEGTSTPEHGIYAVTRNYAHLFRTNSLVKAYEPDGSLAETDKALDVAAVCTRLDLDQYTAEYRYSYLFCAASADFFSNELIGNGSYANFDVVSALVENISRSDEYASITLGGVSFNSDSVGGKELSDQKLYTVSDFSTSQELSSYEKKTFSTDVAVWFTVMIMAVPVTVAGLGIFVCVKRKFK